MPISIREATPEDAAGIAKVIVDTWRAAYRGQMPDSVLAGLNIEERTAFFSRELAREGVTFLVTEEAGEVTGQCCLTPSRDEDVEKRAVAEIVAIYVHPTFWRKGIGSALCRAALEKAASRGFQEVTLWTLESNWAARRFYEARGFTLDGSSKMFKLPGKIELKEIRYRMVF